MYSLSPWPAWPCSSGFGYLNGYQGSVIDWEESNNNGISWNSVGLFTDTLNYSNISTQTLYRSFIQNGVCPNDTANIITLDIYMSNVGVSNDTTIELGTSTTISAYGGLFYSWTPSSSLNSSSNAVTIATPSVTTEYTVLIVDSNGCTYQENVMVSVTQALSELVIADLITTNGDGFNDTWNIIGIENYPDTKVLVFNTTGNTVYESLDYNNEWDGTWNGNPLPDGTYYYIVEIKEETTIRKGFITIVSK